MLLLDCLFISIYIKINKHIVHQLTVGFLVCYFLLRLSNLPIAMHEIFLYNDY